MTDELLKHIGKIVVGFSKLELHLELFTWGLISDNQALGQAITSGMSFSSLTKLFATLLKVKTSDQEILEEFEGIVRRLNEVNERRNQIIHSYWTYDLETKEDSTLKLKADGFKGIKDITELVTSEKLESFVREIEKLTSDFIRVYMKYNGNN